MHVCMYELFIVQALYIFTVRPIKARCMYVYIYIYIYIYSGYGKYSVKVFLHFSLFVILQPFAKII